MIPTKDEFIDFLILNVTILIFIVAVCSIVVVPILIFVFGFSFKQVIAVPIGLSVFAIISTAAFFTLTGLFYKFRIYKILRSIKKGAQPQGWRCWRVRLDKNHKPVLTSVVQNCVWNMPVGEPTSVDKIEIGGYGYHAFYTKRKLSKQYPQVPIKGIVRGWGEDEKGSVVLFQKGFKAQYLQVMALSLDVPCGRYDCKERAKYFYYRKNTPFEVGFVCKKHNFETEDKLLGDLFDDRESGDIKDLLQQLANRYGVPLLEH